jgi:dTDP-4-dehydrorhamnose reductase
VKTAIIGANGQLGADVCAAFSRHGFDIIPVNHDHADIADVTAIRRILTTAKPDCVINTAAMHNVEKCELNPCKAYEVNAIGVHNLCTICSEIDSCLIHISTDYVFNGAKKVPYVEDDAPLPLNVYANSKVAGEYYVRTLLPVTGTVVRVGALYGANPCRAKSGLNFVRLMLKAAKERPEIRVVDDEIVTPTSTTAVAEQLVVLARAKAAGVFHATCQGACSWFAFAERIFTLSGISPNLQKANPGEFPAKTPRPSYSVLDNKRLKELKLDVMPDWPSALAEYLKTIQPHVS